VGRSRHWLPLVCGPTRCTACNRILALRDLGVRLSEIAVLLDEDLSVDELPRHPFLLRRAEAHETRRGRD